jgi:hypothetical protein
VNSNSIRACVSNKLRGIPSMERLLSMAMKRISPVLSTMMGGTLSVYRQ